ncbi:uncharacterized protein LOC34618721 [Cyclospora cayetanensis]|uniref:Uncharacterized protein LOC34618721 n=1 Tax=Cyclospora cayetanensis TaxID=88456 RepID=A0A6P6RX52_9EIME|nr:uncharacterized protein LOC34618721 [Cyclospora cayetanensis]
MEAYTRVSSGSLRLKGKGGDLKKLKKKERKRREREVFLSGELPSTSGEPAAAAEVDTAGGIRSEEGVLPVGEAEVIEGTGRIVATGDTVQGFHTKFRHEIEEGDTLSLLHPATLLPEEALVVSVNTDRTLHIHPGFSKDFISTTTFAVKKTAAAVRARAAAAAARKRSREARGEQEDGAHDAAAAAAAAAAEALNKKIKKGSRIVSVREKKGMWGYTVKQVKLKEELSAEEKLNMRCKQGRDKFCW